MNIGIDARLWYESGVGRYIRNLVKGLDEKKLKNHTFTIFLNPKAYRLINFESPNFKKIESTISWHSFSEQIRFKMELEKENLDLIHFPYFSYPIFYKKPFVITIHDLIIDHFPTGMASSLPLPFYYAKRIGYQKIIRSAIKNAEHVIVPSNATKMELQSHYRAKNAKIDVIYEGFDQLISENSAKEPLVSKSYILYVGNAYPHKNIDMLLNAFSKLKDEIDVDLVCIGRKDFFYERLEKQEHERVHFLHNIDDSVLFEYYRHARFLIMPSLMEGFGLPILEAMSLSCPIVASNTKALVEVANDAAVYFDPKSLTDMCEVIKKVLGDDKLRSSMCKKGIEQSKKFSWKKCIDQTIKVYENCNSV
jgi:glycosyltransferase involved in cell wall biosynthesis